MRTTSLLLTSVSRLAGLMWLVVACGPTPQDHGNVTDAAIDGGEVAIDADQEIVDAT